MAKQTINVGSSANDGTGDTLRVSQQKANSNFTELYDRGLQQITDVNNVTTNEIKAFMYTTGVGDVERLIADETGALISYNNILLRDTNFETNGIELNITSALTDSRTRTEPDKEGMYMVVNTADNYANDTLAAAGGIPIGGAYHTAGIVKIRLT